MEGFSKLSICLLISCISFALCAQKPECIHQGQELWPHKNPNFFWLCLDLNEQPIEVACQEGKGFLRNKNRSGCIKWKDWNCTPNTYTPPTCVSDEEYNRPQRHPNPNKFWACPEGQGTQAVELNCAKGRGFVYNKNNLGCVPWEATVDNEDEWVCGEADNVERD